MKRLNKPLPESIAKLKLDIQFCTECEKDLDNFFLSKRSKDVKAVKDNHENCKNTGKFNGEMCSKLFIAKFEEEMMPPEDTDDEFDEEI